MNPVVVKKVSIGTGIPKICVPMVGETREELCKEAAAIRRSPADLAEWRADRFASVFQAGEAKNVLMELHGILEGIPLLFTFRTKAEGGREISYEAYTDLLQAAAATNTADLIDVEVFLDERTPGLIAALKKTGATVIGSNHDFNGTPSKDEMVRRLRFMADAGADIAKLAVMPHDRQDVRMLLAATAEVSADPDACPLITMAMSKLGAASRVCGEVFGSAVTFGALEKASAPGQIEVQELKRILEILHRE